MTLNYIFTFCLKKIGGISILKCLRLIDVTLITLRFHTGLSKLTTKKRDGKEEAGGARNETGESESEMVKACCKYV